MNHHSNISHMTTEHPVFSTRPCRQRSCGVADQCTPNAVTHLNASDQLGPIQTANIQTVDVSFGLQEESTW